MDGKTSCLSCHGTGTIPGPFDPRPGYPAHAYSVICGCGVMLEKPWFAAANYEKGGILPFRTHRQVLAQANGWVAWVDEKLLDDIGRLWTAGMETYNSCQDNEGRWLSLPEVHVTRARDMLPWVSVTQKAFRGILLLERQRREKRA